METSLARQAGEYERICFQSLLDGFEGSSSVTLEPLWLEDHIYGYRVKETPTHYIDILRMIFNWRIVETVKANPMLIDRGWVSKAHT